MEVGQGINWGCTAKKKMYFERTKTEAMIP
jgi:hypothetical protein